MHLRYTWEEEQYRDEVRAWLGANLPRDWEDIDDGASENMDRWMAFLKDWQRKMHEAGWAGISWPKEYGGRGATMIEQAIFVMEATRAETPPPVNVLGLAMGGPVVIAHGTEEQKQRYLEPILTAEEIWCQGF